MSPLRIVGVIAFLLAVASGSEHHHHVSNMINKLRPSQWLSTSELQQIPSVEDISLQKLASMPLEKGTQLIEKICKYKVI